MRQRACGPLVLAIALAAGALGCERDVGPQLIRVTEMVPREAEVGDKVEISGEGFPQGRPAHVRFRGVLRRPGEAPEDAEIEATGTATSAQSVEVAFDDELQARFCGAGARVRHTTFAGEVEVAFAPLVMGAAPVAGGLSPVALDVRPAIAPRRLEAARLEGMKALAALGLRTRADGRALVVESVDAGSAAHAASILPGDQLVEWAGVRVASEADVSLPPGAASVRVSVRRGGAAAEQAHEIATAGVAPARATDVASAVLVLALALGAVLGLASPRPRWWTRLELRVAAGRLPRPSWIELAGLALVAALPAIAHGLARVDLEVVPALLACGAAFVGAAALSARSAPSVRFPRAVAAARALGMIAPAALALLAATYVSGALRVGDAIRAQGAWPWSWEAVRAPSSLLLLALALAPFAVAPAEPQGASLAVAERALGTWVASLLAAVLLGGWAIPGLGDHGAAGVGLGAVLHGLKTLALVAPVAMLRASLPPLPSARAARLVWTRVLPAAAACAGASVALALLVPPQHARVVTAAGAGLAAIALASVVRVVRARREGPRTLAPSAL